MGLRAAMALVRQTEEPFPAPPPAVYLAGFVLLLVIFLAYVGWHVWLKFVKKADVSHAVWLVALCMLLSLLPDLIDTGIAYGTSRSDPPPSLWIEFVQILFSIGWCFALFLLARGYYVLAPALSDAAKVHLKQLLVLGGVVVLAMLLSALPVSPNIAFSIRLTAGVLVIVFTVFYIMRFFQGVAMSRATIETLNLIPQVRRTAFDTRYKRFLILCVSVVVLTIASYVVVFALAAAGVITASAILALKILDIVTSFVFNAGLAYLFHALPSESLKLWSATVTDLGGFANLQEQDADLFD